MNNNPRNQPGGNTKKLLWGSLSTPDPPPAGTQIKGPIGMLEEVFPSGVTDP